MTEDLDYDAAQAAHEARMREDPQHDQSPCVCCCMDCDDLMADVHP